MSCDPDSLLEEARCLIATIPEGAVPFVILGQWCQAGSIPDSFTPPLAPSNLVVAPSGSQEQLTWTNNADNAVWIDIQRSVDGGDFADLASIDADLSSYLDSTANTGLHTYVYRIRARNYGGSSYWVSSWTPASETGMAGWWRADAGVVATLGVVDTWDDQSGNSRTMANATNRPSVLTDGVAPGLNAIRFDGTNDNLKTAAFTLNQPFSVYTMHKHRTYAASARIYNGITDGFVYASGATPNITMRTGGSVGSSVAPPINTWTVITYLWNGASSIGQIQNQLPQGGNPGAGNFGGLCMAATAVPGNFGAVDFGEMIVRTGIDNALTRFRHVTWLQRRAQFAYFNLICEGDSLTAGAGLAEGNLFPYRFLQAKGLTTSGWNYQIRATGGEDIPDLEARAGATDKYLDQVRSVLCVWIGSNDLVSLPGSAVATEAALASYCEDRQRMGWEVAVFTTLPRNAGPTFEADRQAYNTLIRANWHSYADHLVDIGANSTIGDNGDQNNLTYYIVGGVHLTAAGQLIVGNYLATIIT